MKKKRISLWLLLLLLCFACQEEFAPIIEEEEVVSPASNYDPGQPHKILFTTPGPTYYQGQTVLGWENFLIQRGESNLGGTGAQLAPQNVVDCHTGDYLKLYQNGVYLRDLSPREVNLYYEYTCLLYTSPSPRD